MLDHYFPFVTAGVIGLAVAAMLSIVYATLRNGISPMPASAPVRRAIVREVNRLPEVSTIVDAGSGWGTLTFAISNHCPDKHIIGIENSPIPFLVSRLFVRGRISFIRGDLYSYDYKNTDLVICYLYPGAMKRLSPMFRERLAPGTRIMSICFALPGWEATQVLTCNDLYRTKIYVYMQKPAACKATGSPS